MNLRPLFGSLPPLLADIRDDLGLSAAAAGLLTTGPLLAGHPGAARPADRAALSGRAGAAVACFVTAIGTAMRGLGGIAPLYLGTLLAGAAIALTQVVTPAWVRAKAAAAAPAS